MMLPINNTVIIQKQVDKIIANKTALSNYIIDKNYIDNKIKKIDELLASKYLGESMRTHLTTIKKDLETNPDDYVAKAIEVITEKIAMLEKDELAARARLGG